MFRAIFGHCCPLAIVRATLLYFFARRQAPVAAPSDPRHTGKFSIECQPQSAFTNLHQLQSALVSLSQPPSASINLNQPQISFSQPQSASISLSQLQISFSQPQSGLSQLNQPLISLYLGV